MIHFRTDEACLAVAFGSEEQIGLAITARKFGDNNQIDSGVGAKTGLRYGFIRYRLTDGAGCWTSRRGVQIARTRAIHIDRATASAGACE